MEGKEKEGRGGKGEGRREGRKRMRGGKENRNRSITSCVRPLV